MRRVALIHNPASGRYSARREASIQEVLSVLRAAGVEAESFVTSSVESVATYAEQAVSQGCDAILACGGDGTVHALLQSLVGTDVALGVIPLGTANALAANLGLTGTPAQAARILVNASPVRIPVGRIHFQNKGGAPDSRYFLVAAGVGADALLMSRLDAELKRRFGYVLYLVEALRIWATHSFPLFEAAFANSSDAPRVSQVSQLLAVRVRSFGGVLREFAPGATLRNRTLHLIAFATRSRLRYLRFLLAAMAGRHTFANEIALIETTSVDCRACNGSREILYVEADGEVLGTLPARMETVPEALTLLIPQGAQP